MKVHYEVTHLITENADRLTTDQGLVSWFVGVLGYFVDYLIRDHIVVGDSSMTRIMDLPKGYINQELSW